MQTYRYGRFGSQSALLLATWLLTHRYTGIQHDGVLYALQAQAWLHPENYRADLFFAYGSQSDYTLFPALYATLAAWTSLGTASAALLTIASIAWVAAAAFLARRLSTGNAFFVLLMLAVLPRGYGSGGMFHYAEPFLTARSWAEPLILLSLGCAVGQQWRAALALSLGAMAIHPLMALPGVIFLLALRGLGRPILLGVGVLLTLIGVLALSPTMEGEWYLSVLTRSSAILPDRWPLNDFGEPIACLALLWIAIREDTGSNRPFWQAALITGTIALVAALAGALAHASWLIQLQPWRGFWLVKILALMALGGITWRDRAVEGWPRWRLVALWTAWITASAGGALALICLAMIGPAHSGETSPPDPSPRVMILLKLAITALLFLVVIDTLQAVSTAVQVALDPNLPKTPHPWFRFLSLFDGAPSLLLFLAALWVVGRLRTAPLLSMLLAGLLLAMALYAWRQPLAAEQTLLYSANQVEPFAGNVPPGALVYWDGRPEYAWFLLGRGSYASAAQTAGIVFSAATASEAERRLARLTSANPVELCTDPILDFVVTSRAENIPVVATWTDPTNGEVYRLIDCKAIRRNTS